MLIFLIKGLELTIDKEVRNAMSQSLSSMVSNSGDSLFRVSYYPCAYNAEISKAARSSKHEDVNILTLMPAVSVPGLQLQDNEGNWHDFYSDDDLVLVKVGDMMSELTKGYFNATTHRVVFDDEENFISRLSMMFFLHPSPDVVLSSKYTAKDYLNLRLSELGYDRL